MYILRERTVYRLYFRSSRTCENCKVYRRWRSRWAKRRYSALRSVTSGVRNWSAPVSRGEFQVSLVLDGTVAVRVATAVRCPGPRPGSIRVTVARDQGVHTAGSIDRYTLTSSVMVEAFATWPAAIHQRCPEVLHRADVRVWLGCARTAT